MPVILANDWTADRAEFGTNDDGSVFFKGDLVIKFWLDEKYNMYTTGTQMEINVSKKKSKVVYEHEAKIPKVVRSKNGFDGWFFRPNNKNNDTIVLSLGRRQREKTEEDKTEEDKNDEVIETKKNTAFIQTEEQLTEIFKPLPVVDTVNTVGAIKIA